MTKEQFIEEIKRQVDEGMKRMWESLAENREGENPPAQDAREIIIKHALWDAGFCGEQSAERGPVMLKVFELVECAFEEGAQAERSNWITLQEEYALLKQKLAAAEAERDESVRALRALYLMIKDSPVVYEGETPMFVGYEMKENCLDILRSAGLGEEK